MQRSWEQGITPWDGGAGLSAGSQGTARPQKEPILWETRRTMIKIGEVCSSGSELETY